MGHHGKLFCYLLLSQKLYLHVNRREDYFIYILLHTLFVTCLNHTLLEIPPLTGFLTLLLTSSAALYAFTPSAFFQQCIFCSLFWLLGWMKGEIKVLEFTTIPESSQHKLDRVFGCRQGQSVALVECISAHHNSFDLSQKWCQKGFLE